MDNNAQETKRATLITAGAPVRDTAGAPVRDTVLTLVTILVYDV